jgi:hypothetical protein
MDKELYPVLDYLKQMYGYALDPQGIEVLARNKNAVLDLFYNGNYGFGEFYDELSKKYPIERYTNYYDELSPTQRRISQGSKALTGFDAQPVKNVNRLTKFEKPMGALGKPASSIMKGARGVAHLIPIVGAGLTAADIYQGLNQPVGAASVSQMSPEELQQIMNNAKNNSWGY